MGPVSSDILTSKITWNRSKPMVEKVCLWAKTNGSVKVAREIDFEVCGSEEVYILNGQTTENYEFLYWDYDIKNTNQRYKHIQMSLNKNTPNLKSRFISKSPNCPVRYWELHDAPYPAVSPLITSSDIIVWDAEAEQISVTTEIYNWEKKIYLRNKNMNPTMECNWQCYKERYPTDLGALNIEEVQQHWYLTDRLLTGAAARNC